MSQLPYNATTPEEAIGIHLEMSRFFDVPEGRHQQLISEYCESAEVDFENPAQKAEFILSTLKDFNGFLKTKEDEYKTKTSRLDAKRQAELEPIRMQEAKEALSKLGFDVKAVNSTELSFNYKGATIKYYPYSQWASGKTIADGRGLKKLLEQLVD